MASQLKISLWIATCGFALLCNSASFGQARRYKPASPTVSPYLNLLRTNTGPVPNYHSFVRPLQQQRASNLQNQARIRQQAITLQRFQSDLQRSRQPIAPTGTGSWFMKPGTRSTFLNTSRFYSQAPQGARRR